MKTVFPYRHVVADKQVALMPLGEQEARPYRFVAYLDVAGRPGEQPGIAVMDETRGLVLVDGLYAGQVDATLLPSLVEQLSRESLSTIAASINAHPEARYTLSPTGEILDCRY